MVSVMSHDTSSLFTLIDAKGLVLATGTSAYCRGVAALPKVAGPVLLVNGVRSSEYLAGRKQAHEDLAEGWVPRPVLLRADMQVHLEQTVGESADWTRGYLDRVFPTTPA